jgi:outer membrane protein TolC
LLPKVEGEQPIDLPTALQLANAQSPEIALARERINEALARHDQAKLLWLPNFEFNASYMSHRGLIQRAAGEVFDTERSSLGLPAAVGLNLHLGDALYAPLAAQQAVEARRAAATGASNDVLLETAIAYIDLSQAHSELQINDDALRNARNLLSIAESFEKAGKGAAADTARARVEVNRRERFREQIQGRIGLASTRLTALLFLPQQTSFRPIESAVVPIALVSEAASLSELIGAALTHHPALAANRAEIEAVLQNWKRAKTAPWLPTLRLAYAAGGFGGGQSGWNDFGSREDFAAAAVWQLQNLGLGNRAAVRERQSQFAQAHFRQMAIEARVANDVASAFNVAYARRREIAHAEREVASARDSYKLNEERLRKAPDQARPIELLQALQSQTQAYFDYLQVVSDYNRAQFRLYNALGRNAACSISTSVAVPISERTVPASP